MRGAGVPAERTHRTRHAGRALVLGSLRAWCYRVIVKPVSDEPPDDGASNGRYGETGGRGRPVAIRDVAALARESPATASRTLNGDKTVRRDMRDRVFAAAETLNVHRFELRWRASAGPFPERSADGPPAPESRDSTIR